MTKSWQGNCHNQGRRWGLTPSVFSDLSTCTWYTSFSGHWGWERVGPHSFLLPVASWFTRWAACFATCSSPLLLGHPSFQRPDGDERIFLVWNFQNCEAEETCALPKWVSGMFLYSDKNWLAQKESCPQSHVYSRVEHCSRQFSLHKSLTACQSLHCFKLTNGVFSVLATKKHWTYELKYRVYLVHSFTHNVCIKAPSIAS